MEKTYYCYPLRNGNREVDRDKLQEDNLISFLIGLIKEINYIWISIYRPTACDDIHQMENDYNPKNIYRVFLDFRPKHFMASL